MIKIILINFLTYKCISISFLTKKIFRQAIDLSIDFADKKSKYRLIFLTKKMFDSFFYGKAFVD